LARPEHGNSGQCREQNYDLKVAYVVEVDLTPRIKGILKEQREMVKHLDQVNENVTFAEHTDDFFDDPDKPIMAAHAYLGAQAVRKELDEDADYYPL
jgi:hypothetical protein